MALTDHWTRSDIRHYLWMNSGNAFRSISRDHRRLPRRAWWDFLTSHIPLGRLCKGPPPAALFLLSSEPLDGANRLWHFTKRVSAISQTG
jgi:hypothetical protein